MSKRKISLLTTAAIAATTIFGGITVGTASAEVLSSSTIKRLEFVDKNDKPITGNINNESLKTEGLKVKARVEFPDDAQPGDIITFNMNVPMNFSISEKTFSNDNDEEITELKISTDRIKSTTTFSFELLETAKDLVNRAVDITISSRSNLAIDCDPAKPWSKTKISVSSGDDTVPTVNTFTFDRNKCSEIINTYPEPTAGVTVPGSSCWANSSAHYRKEAISNSSYVKEGMAESTDENSVAVLSSAYVGVSPGSTKKPLAKSLLFTYDGGISKDQFTTLYDGDVDKLKDDVGLRPYIEMGRIPAVFESYENKEEGMTSENQNTKFKPPIPKNLLFPTRELAQEFKKAVVDKMGEDYYYNRNDAFAKSPDKEEAGKISSKVANKWLRENALVKNFNKTIPKYQIYIKNGGGFTSPVTSEGVMLSDEGVKPQSDRRTFGFSFPGVSAIGYAPYTGPASYGFKIKLESGNDDISSECEMNKPDEESIGEISGAAYGDPLPPREEQPEEEIVIEPPESDDTDDSTDDENSSGGEDGSDNNSENPGNSGEDGDSDNNSEEPGDSDGNE